MRVIGLDLGLDCGYAWTDRDVVVGANSGEWTLRGHRYEGAGMRFLRFNALLRELIITAPSWPLPPITEPASSAAPPPGVAVFFEIASSWPGKSKIEKGKGTAFSRELFGGFFGQLSGLCEELGVPYDGVRIGDIKRAACGRYRATKEDVVAAARERFGVRLLDEEHNRADALWCLQVGLDQLAPGGAARPVRKASSRK